MCMYGKIKTFLVPFLLAKMFFFPCQDFHIPIDYICLFWCVTFFPCQMAQGYQSMVVSYFCECICPLHNHKCIAPINYIHSGQKLLEHEILTLATGKTGTRARKGFLS